MSNKGVSVKKLRETVNKVYNSTEYVKNREKMDEYLSIFEGTIWDEKHLDEQDSRVHVNYLFSTVMTIAPMLTDNRPIWGIRARDYFMQRYLELYNYALEYLWDKEEIDMKIFDATLSALVMKLGMFKVWFNYENGVFGDVGIEVINPKTFIIASGYTDPWEAPWCGEKMSKPLYWVKEKYPKHWMNIKPDADEKVIDYSKSENVELTEKYCTIYEIWLKDDEIEEYIEEEEQTVRNAQGIEAKVTVEVKKERKKYPNGRILVFADNYDKFLEDKPSPFQHGKAPYVPLYDYKIPFKFMGMGEGDQILGLYKEANLTIRKIANHVRNWATPNFTGETNNGIDPGLFKKQAKGGGNYFARQPGSAPPEEIKVNPINRTAMEFLYFLPTAIEEVTAVTDITKGMAEKKQRQSAREIATLVETAYTRTRQRVRNLEWSIKRLCYLMVCMMQQYYSEIRQVSYQREDNIIHREISNSQAFVNETLRPNPEVEPQTPEEADEIELQQKDYEAFLQSTYKEVDRIYAEFDITIETNSTLPLDKQSLANLYLQLANIQLTPNSAIDVESLLEGLHIPKKGKIVEKLKAALAAQQQPQPGQPAAAGM